MRKFTAFTLLYLFISAAFLLDLPRALASGLHCGASSDDGVNQAQRSLTYQAYQHLLARVSSKTARERSATILSALELSGKYVREGRLDRAAALLDDDFLLKGSGFHLQARSLREAMSRIPRGSMSEQDYATALRQSEMQPAHVDQDGTIILPTRPTFDESTLNIIQWLTRDWIRMAAEHLGQVAQILNIHGGGKGLISEAFRTEWNNQHSGDAPSPLDRLIKADVHAYMLEIFGSRFILK